MSAGISNISTGSRWVAVLVALITLVLPISAGAAAVDELFADGNRLFREDLYWAALLRYRQAEEAGLSSPMLHYNMGVAHYKAQQHVRARESLKNARSSAKLEVYATYNLGLNAWALGDIDEALQWFRKSRDQQQNERISELAAEAIRRINRESFEEELVIVKAQARERERDVSNFDFHARIGGGVDSNVFRSPSEPYTDLSNPNQPTITPVVQQGFFIPASLAAKYSVHSFEHESFFGAYRFGGRFYQDKALENGNEYKHEIRFGTEYERREKSRTRRLYSAFAIAQHDEVYYDRDSGGTRTVNDVDIADRFDYIRYGPEIWFRQSHDRLSLGFRAKGQLWNYKDTVEVPEFDHKYLLLGINAQYRFTSTSLIRFTGDVYQRHFTDRPSFELDGSQPIGNPPVEYDYIEAGIRARQRVYGGLWFGLDYVRTQRDDRHAGYNDYTKNSYGAEVHWRFGPRFDIEANAIFQIYDYKNAFAFQNPAAGRKTLERGLASFIASFVMTRNLELLTEYRYDTADSNDARIAYNRGRISLTIRWENR